VLCGQQEFQPARSHLVWSAQVVSGQTVALSWCSGKSIAWDVTTVCTVAGFFHAENPVIRTVAELATAAKEKNNQSIKQTNLYFTQRGP